MQTSALTSQTTVHTHEKMYHGTSTMYHAHGLAWTWLVGTSTMYHGTFSYGQAIFRILDFSKAFDTVPHESCIYSI